MTDKDMQCQTPREIVKFLDDYIIGQNDAKRAVAIALRNRYRRMQLPKEVQEEIMPKNILMIGSTGVGKTEIARRMAKLMGLPFVKVEASKYTEVGFVGRDVESMIRDLVVSSVAMVESEHKENLKEQIEEYVIEKIAQKLLPPLPSGADESKKQDYQKSKEKMINKIKNGEMDHLKIEVEISKKSPIQNDDGMPPEMIKIQESIVSVLSAGTQKLKKELSVLDAKSALLQDATSEMLDYDIIKSEGLKRAEQSGVIFIDEIDKVAVSSKNSSRNDPSKEGVQRDLLPIVEGSVVNTKYGQIRTDYILFIAAGAFAFAKPSDLIPELQGRFPLRVELSELDEESLYLILTKTKNSLLNQYQLLLLTEKVELEFSDEAIREIAKLTYEANKKTENIGARRLHTTIEKILEDISFESERYKDQKIEISKDMVRDKLANLVENVDLTRYIL